MEPLMLLPLLGIHFFFWGAGTFSWQDPAHPWKAGPGEIMTMENLTLLTVLAVCNGTFNAAAFDGNPFLLFWGGGESSGWPTKRGEGKRPILRMASQSSLFCL